MTGTRSRSFEWVRRPPIDLVAVVALVLLADVAVFHPIVSDTPLRILTGTLFVLFAPGYALVAALFPANGRDAERGPNLKSVADGRALANRSLKIDRWERLGLSVALSLALVPLLAFALTLVSLSSPTVAFTTFSLFMTISAFTLLCAVVAAIRRSALPQHQRFRLRVDRWFADVRRSFSENSRTGSALNVALVVAVLLAVGTFGFAVASPPDGEMYTEFYLVSENDDGEFVAAEYPDSVTPGESLSMHAGVENYEGETTDYEVVVQLQRVEETDEGAVVAERTEIDRFSVRSLAPGERQITERNLTVSDELTGEDLRLEFLLYKDSVPESPTRETAYRSLHVWVDVPADDQTSTTADGGTLD